MLTNEVKQIADKLLAAIKEEAKDEWDNWSQGDRDLVRECADDAAWVLVNHLGGEDIANEKRHIDAQLANIQAAGQGSAATLFWKIFDRFVKVAVGAILSIA